jgi:transcriptional regulator with XRE-family HTH domain
MSQAELAKELDISSAYLCQIESGKRKPTLDLIEKYAKLFEVPMSALLLFSERLESSTLKEKSRAYVANRMLGIIEALTCRDIVADE